MVWPNVNFRVGRYVLDYLPVWWYLHHQKWFSHDLHNLFDHMHIKEFAQFTLLKIRSHLVRLLWKIHALSIEVLSRTGQLTSIVHVTSGLGWSLSCLRCTDWTSAFDACCCKEISESVVPTESFRSVFVLSSYLDTYEIIICSLAGFAFRCETFLTYLMTPKYCVFALSIDWCTIGRCSIDSLGISVHLQL